MAKKRTTRRTGRRPAKGRGKVSQVMREYKHRTLRSGSGGKVRKREQAVAIALSEARRSGDRIPRRRRSRAR